MSTSLEYSRTWTNAEDFPLLGFTRSWENPEDYPTIETDEIKVRRDMQSLHDETKDFINNDLIPKIIADEALEAARAAAEAQRETNETARQAAEQASADEHTGLVAQAKAAAAEQVELAKQQVTKSEKAGAQQAEIARNWANKAQGYAESATVPAVAGVYNLVLADRVTSERYALIIENGRPKLLGVADTLDAATMRLIDTSTGVAYELIVESGRLKTLEVE